MPLSIREMAGAFGAIASVAAAGLLVSAYLRFVFAGPTPDLYVAHNAPTARRVTAGDLSFNGVSFTCGRFPTVFNPKFADYGAAFFGFIVLNPDRFGLLPLSVKRFAYAHECGHQYVGYSEAGADCYAVKQGLGTGWLDAASVEEICAFFSRSKGTALHLPGPQRCSAIRACYQRQKPNL